MIVNKKFDRLKQWGKERMGGEVATNASDEFKALEMEMDLRHSGMEKLSNASNAYIKSLNKRDCGESKDKTTAIAHFGSTLTAHGDDFEADSEFGQCLLHLGRANERIARLQETFTANATSSWLESVERSQIQMKEYAAARKRLDSRRLAYDAASAKVQKSKKEDFRVEEELRSQKAKYEESYEEVVRRMLDVKEAEGDTVADLSSFLECQYAYFDKCRDILAQLRRDWPAASSGTYNNGGGVSIPRGDTASPAPSLSGGGGPILSRRNTGTLSRSRASSINTYASGDEAAAFGAPLRNTISSTHRLPSGQNSPRRELPGFDLPARPAVPGRSASGFEGPTATGGYAREQSPVRGAAVAPPPRLSRVPTEPIMSSSQRISEARGSLRVTKNRPESSVYGGGDGSVFGDDASEVSESPGGYGNGGANGWQSGSMVGQDGSNVSGGGGKRAPPPPPPSRSKKPPPPPPMKRSALSTSDVLNY